MGRREEGGGRREGEWREEGGYRERGGRREEGGKGEIEKAGWMWEEVESEFPDARLLIFVFRSSDRPLGEGDEGWMWGWG
jgi:hypothetical protein